jgi:rRNA maturation endonuclease Nob1
MPQLGIPELLICLGPIIVVFLFVRYAIARAIRNTRVCPFCSKKINTSAKVCPYCGRDMP